MYGVVSRWIESALLDHWIGGKMANKEGESKKLSAAIEKLAKSGLKVTDGTCKGKGIGFVGGSGVPSGRAGTTVEITVRSRP